MYASFKQIKIAVGKLFCLSAPALGLVATLASGFMAAVVNAEQAVPVEIRKLEQGYQVFRDGVPYDIKGAGLSDANDTEFLLQQLKAAGANSIRTWHVGNGKILDQAHKLGLTVSLCLDVKRERHGFDYNNQKAVAQQLKKFRKQVLKHKDHPALLAWIIGNELNHDYKNPKVYDAVNNISKMIHELDPHHPTTTTTAGINNELAQVIQARAPDLDFLSVQVYGGLLGLGDALNNIQLNKPLMVTEWGTVGHWEVDKTLWNAPIELTSEEKAGHYLLGFTDVIKPLQGQVIGNYMFLWGQKQERTPTWYGVFTANMQSTPAVDVMHYIWRGKWPDNRAPNLTSMTLGGKQAYDNVLLKRGKKFVAQVQVADETDTAELNYRWQLLAESDSDASGGDYEELPRDFSRFVKSTGVGTAEVKAPIAGRYRLFVTVSDEQGKAAHANIPFIVQ